MRTGLSTELVDAQVAQTRTPYIYLNFTSKDGNTTYDLSMDSITGNKILLIDHFEEAYNEYATIVLQAADRDSLPDDLTGYSVDIGYGDITINGAEFESTPTLWVKFQQDVFASGKATLILYCEGMWAKLRETILRMGDPPYYQVGNDANNVVYDAIALILAEIDPTFGLFTLVQDDGVISTFVPNFQINGSQPFENAASVIYSVLKMTYSVLRSKVGLTFEVIWPQETDEAVITFHRAGFRSAGEHGYYNYVRQTNVLLPNQILVFANAGDDLLWNDIDMLESTADDTESQDKYAITPEIVLAPLLTTQGEADLRAAVVLNRLKIEAPYGKLVIPHDCQLELYDRVGVT